MSNDQPPSKPDAAEEVRKLRMFIMRIVLWGGVIVICVLLWRWIVGH